MAVFLLLLIPTLSQPTCPLNCLAQPCSSPCYSTCGISCTDECSENCKYQMINDSICQPACQVEPCGYDAQDCHTRKLYTTITVSNSSDLEEDNEVEEKNYGKVAGVGLGVFLTIMMMLVGIVICVIGAATPIFFVFLLLGILIPLITFLIVAFAPLHKDQEEKADTRTDDFFPARLLFLIFIVIFAVFAVIKLFEYYVGINLKAKGVNSNISKISSADLVAPIDSQGPVGYGDNPLAGPQGGDRDLLSGGPNLNPLAGEGRNPLGGNRNPLAGDSRNPLMGAPEEHPLAPPSNPLLRK